MTPEKRSKILRKIQGGRASRAERLALKQEGLCFYCHLDLERDVTKEHLDSKARGGGNEMHNLRVAHMVCNGIVGSLPVELKLELHEIGRDHGAEAFWRKARDYQARYGNDPNAYRKHKPGPYAAQRTALANARRGNQEDVREVRPEDAERELHKLELGQPGLSKAQREQAVQEEVERRKQTGLPVQLGFIGWMQMMESLGWCMPAARAAGGGEEGLEAA